MKLQEFYKTGMMVMQLEMPKRLFIFCAVLFVSCASIGAGAQAQYAIENTNVITLDGRGLLNNMTVLVEGDRITAVTPAADAEIPDAFTRINGAGKFLTPGFAEMHGHIPPASQGAAAIDDILFLYIANGVTTVRGMLGGAGQLALRADILSGAREGPTLYLAGPSFNGNSITSPEQARRRVEDQVQQGWDLLKIHPGLTRTEYDAMDETADSLNMPYAGHVPSAVGLARALEARQRTIDHLDGYIAFLGGARTVVSDAALTDIARKTKAAGVGVVPTSSLWATIIGAADVDELSAREDMRYVSKAARDNWVRNTNRRAGADIHNENRRRLLKTMADEGVEILFGTDAPQRFSVPGFSIRHEIQEMSAAGLSNEQILFSATAAVGAYFEDKDQFGHIAEGMRADMILTARNPMTDLSALNRPDGVMVRGRWLSRAFIDQELEAIAARANGN